MYTMFECGHAHATIMYSECLKLDFSLIRINQIEVSFSKQGNTMVSELIIGN